MTTNKKNRGVNVKGYYTRARVFGYMLLLVFAGYLLYNFYRFFIA